MSIYGPCPKAEIAAVRRTGSHAAEGVDLRPYAKKSYVNHRLNQHISVSGGTMTGTLDMNGSRIINLPDVGRDPGDACSVAFVDRFVTSNGKQYVTRDGDQSMQADLDLGGHKVVRMLDPTTAQEGATKSYVDAAR